MSCPGASPNYLLLRKRLDLYIHTLSLIGIMGKDAATLLLLGILLACPLVLAQEQAQTYSGFDRFVDDVKLAFSRGDNKVRLALEVREKEIDSAIGNIKNQGEDEAIENLERAKQKLQIVQEKVSLKTSNEIKENVNEIIDKVNKEEDLPDEFEEYLLEEEKTQLTAELTEKTYEYCRELAKEDFALMLKEEECNPKTAPEPLKDDLEKLKDLQLRMFVQLMLEIRSCIDDPGTCNCEANVDAGQKVKCEKMVALALKCEYKNDETACSELKSMEPKKGDNFAESFVPDFLRNLFREKEHMIDYDMDPSCGVPEECWDENDKPECRQYDHLKETKDDWDEYGNYIGTKKECGTKGPIPMMQESIPQCFDENDNFLEEKCGKITMVENEEGLINYIIEKEIEDILDEFENKSMQNTIDENNTVGGGEWTIDESGKEINDQAREIKNEIDGIKGQIAGRTFAPGTYGTGDSKNDTKDVVVEEGKEGSGDGGLKPEIKTDVAGDGSGGGLKPVVKTDVAGDGNNVVDNVVVEDDRDNVIDIPSKTKDNEDVSPEPDDFVNEVDEDENPSEDGTVGDVDED